MMSRDDRPGKKSSRNRWIALAVTFVSLIGLSFILAYFFGKLTARVDVTQYNIAWLAYIIVFAVSLLSNLTIVAPVPFAVAIMIAASTKWNPAMIGLMGAAGGAIGELSGYYAGYLGQRIALSSNMPGYDRLEHWIRKYGIWAIFLLALQPIIPFDVGGLIAGAARMPLHKFLPALFLGKLIKYGAVAFLGATLSNSLPWLAP